MKLTHYDEPPYGFFPYSDVVRKWDGAYFHFLSRLMRCWHPYHGNGILQKALWVDLEGAKKETCDAKEFFTYQGDVNHKLIHCINVAFWATYQETENPNWEKIVASCLVHDFIKAASPDNANHDLRLMNIFPHLEPAAYTHWRDPDDSHPLVQGDRIDLLRFEDYNDWLHWEMLPSWVDRSELEIFYRYINRALEHVFFNMDELWIRHGIEPNWLISNTMRKGKGSKAVGDLTMYPYQWWNPPEHPGYCVETGFLRDLHDEQINRLMQSNAISGLTLACHVQPLQAQYDHEKVSTTKVLYPDKWLFVVEPYEHLRMVPRNCLGVLSVQTVKLFVRIVTKLKAVLLSYFPC